MDSFRIILAILPFCLFCLLLLFRRSTTLLKISLITLLVTIIIAVAFWYSSPSLIGFSLYRGLLVAFDILLIIFGAMFFLDILKKNNVTDNLAYHLDNFSTDSRVQIIMLAWFLENFLEGIAGFGTPAIVVAPMLVALGLSPLKAIVIALIGNSTSVPFGAVGTPIRVGFSGINIDLTSIASTAAIYNMIGLLVPLFMVWVLVSSAQNRFTLWRQALPFALWAGIAFVVPSYLISLFGFEFPSIIGAIIGMVLVMTTNKLGIFVPKPVYRHLDTPVKPVKILTLGQMILPYALFIVLLVVAKIWLHSGINPGLIFVITTLIVAGYSKINWRDILVTSQQAIGKSIEPFLVVAAMSAVVQLMNNSANMVHQLPSITQTISTLFNVSVLPALAPFISALGSFITGSATVSNLMFGSSLYSSSIFLNFDPVKILSLALVGAGAGNMIALADVLAAKTVVRSNDNLRDIILLILPYCLIYLVLVAIFGMIV